MGYYLGVHNADYREYSVLRTGLLSAGSDKALLEQRFKNSHEDVN